MNRDTGSPSRTLPSSRSIRIATPVTGLDMEAMRNSESVAAGRLDSTSSWPNASRCATRPRRATRVTALAICPAWMWRWMVSPMRRRRSLERPTSSGFARGVAAGTGQESSTRTAQVVTHVWLRVRFVTWNIRSSPCQCAEAQMLARRVGAENRHKKGRRIISPVAPPSTLDSGLWTLDSGLSTLDSRLWTLDSGLDFGLWTSTLD